MKLVIRLCWLLLIGSYVALEMSARYYLERNTALGFGLVAVGAICGLVIVLLLIYYWFKTKFHNKIWKICWIIVILIPYYMIGPAIFYLVVFEFKKTLLK